MTDASYAKLDATDHAAGLSARVVFQLALAGLRARLARSLVTLVSVVVAIAYLTYSGAMNALAHRLCMVDSEEIRHLLRSAGIDVEASLTGNPLDRWLVAMALATCAVGIANAMLMSVTERFREIGTMKCLGAEDATVVKLFLIESGLMGAMGSAIGLGAGLLLALVVGLSQFGRFALTHLPVGAVFPHALFSFGVGIALCLVGAGYPAFLAARMRPVDALRVEE